MSSVCEQMLLENKLKLRHVIIEIKVARIFRPPTGITFQGNFSLPFCCLRVLGKLFGGCFNSPPNVADELIHLQLANELRRSEKVKHIKRTTLNQKSEIVSHLT